jgi:hypothetical protein
MDPDPDLHQHQGRKSDPDRIKYKSGSVSKKNQNPDPHPDPHQGDEANPDPQHCYQLMNICSHWRREQCSRQRKKYTLPTNSAAIHQGGNPNICTYLIKSNKSEVVLSLVYYIQSLYFVVASVSDQYRTVSTKSGSGIQVFR